jgi:alpha-glucuronidase
VISGANKITTQWTRLTIGDGEAVKAKAVTLVLFTVAAAAPFFLKQKSAGPFCASKMQET